MNTLTNNTLDSYQRARLIRSTRKLEAILGSTPHLAEVEPIHVTLPPIDSCPSPKTKASRRHGSIFTIFPIISPSGRHSSDAYIYSSSTNSSVSSLTLPEPCSSVEVLPTPKSFSSNPRRSAEAPRPLVLRVNTIPVQPSDKRIPLSPYSPFVTSMTKMPDTPTCEELPRAPSPSEFRRKKMAKLARTFGENVPPEYVFPTKQHTAKSPSSTYRHPSQEVEPQQIPPAKRTSQIWTTGSPAGAWTGEWNRKDIAEVQHKLRALRAK